MTGASTEALLLLALARSDEPLAQALLGAAMVEVEALARVASAGEGTEALGQLLEALGVRMRVGYELLSR